MSKFASLNRGARAEAGRIVPSLALVEALMEAHVPPAVRERLAGEGPFGLILCVPTAAYVDFVVGALDALLPDPEHVLGIGGRNATGETPALVHGLRNGRVAVAVVTDPVAAPAGFRALADEIVSIPIHDAATVRAALDKVFGPSRARWPKDFRLASDPESICQCILPEAGRAATIRALGKLGAAEAPEVRKDLPPLAECIEYGEARRWGLDVMRDVAAWKAGDIAAADLDTTCLLVGPPGYGKTRFASVLANTMGVRLFTLSVGEAFGGDGHLGDVLQAIRDRFAEAAAAAPAVLLLDEIDAFSRRDAHDNNRSFTGAMIAELLVALDDVSARVPGLVVIGATNRHDGVDPAILRPGRISRTIRMQVPGFAGAEHVLRVQLRGDLLGEPLDDIVRLAGGATPAQLMDAVRTARGFARSENRPLVTADLSRAFLGADHEQDRPMLLRVALHEAGHAMATLILPDTPGLNYLSLGTRNGNLGFVSTYDLAGANTRSRAEGRICMLLAGRAAENLVYGEFDPGDGASVDLRVATLYAAEMRAQLGMCGSLTYFGDVEERLANDRVFAAAVEEDLQRLMATVATALEPFEVHLMGLAAELVRKRYLTADEAIEIVDHYQKVLNTFEEVTNEGSAAGSEAGQLTVH